MIVKPKIIVLLGRISLQNILGKEYKITASRGKWVEKKGILYMRFFFRKEPVPKEQREE